MALLKPFEEVTGVETVYWKLSSFVCKGFESPGHETVEFFLAGYLTQEKRLNDYMPTKTIRYSAPLSVVCDENGRIDRALIYAHIKNMPEFDGALDV